MTQFFIDHVTTYRKYCKSGKGAELENLLTKLEHMLFTEPGFSALVTLLERKLSRLNDLYPRSKKFILKKTAGNLYIQPDDSAKPRSFESDYVAVVGVSRVKEIAYIFKLQDLFNDFEELELANKHENQKGE